MTLDGLDSSEAFVLLDDNLTPQGQALLFQKPVEILRCGRPEEVASTLARIEALNAEGYYLAGSLSYELGYLFEPRLAALLAERLQKTPASAPLIWMAAFKAPRHLDKAALAKLLGPAGSYKTSTPKLSLAREDYIAKVERVRDYIAAGEVYQINFTFKYNFTFSGEPIAFYRNLREKQPVAYGALIHDPDAKGGGFDLLSFSPELFLQRKDNRIWTRPMKGTAARGLDSEGDAAQAAWLRDDEKSRAENLMIVDLLRNDMGRVSEIGSVEVTDLFTVETYRTVLQMTSGITARLSKGTGFQDIIRKIFPCGSITGAPKVRAMEIIHELEPEARGVYTGAIGMIAPNGDCRFNVAIRTLMIKAAKDESQETDRQGEMGIGSGIVYDSNAADEYDECLLKGRFLTGSMEDFELIETLLWQPGPCNNLSGYHLLGQHLERLESSAHYFNFPYNPAAVTAALDSAVTALPAQSHRVRLLLDRRGKLSVTSTEIDAPSPSQILHYVISEQHVDSRDPFFRHKTTRRQLYDGEHARLSTATGCDEVLFLNERGEVAEGSRSNVFIERAGRLITPPLSCGVLAGTLRQSLLEDPGVQITEAVLMPHDLEAADRVLFGNSVRGLQEARALTPVQQRDPATAAV